MSDPSPMGRDGVAVLARRKDRWIGLLIIALTFIGSLGVSIWAKKASRPETSSPPGPPRTDGIVGWPAAVDPAASLRIARELTRRTTLRGFVAEGVRSDGTVDLSEGPGRVRYSFQSPAGLGPQPEREPGTLPRRHYCGRQNVQLRREGLVAERDIPDYPCALEQTDSLPDPRCNLRSVWLRAVEKGAPRERLARIEYYRSRVGPAWRFELPGTPHSFSLYGDCGRELESAEALGTVP